MNHSIKPQERWIVLQRALHLFSHDDVELHDAEINLGTDKALCLKLGYVVVTAQSPYVSKEAALICRCFNEVYKCSSANQLRSFRNIGATELLPLLIQLSKNDMQNGNGGEIRSRESGIELASVFRVLRVFAKLAPAKSFLINYSNGDLVGGLLRAVLAWINNPNSSTLSPTETLWEIMGLVKDLTFRSRTDDKNQLLQSDGEIFFKILSHCLNQLSVLHPRFQEWCTAITWNMVLDPPICHKLLTKNISDKQQFGNIITESLLAVMIQHSAHGKNSSLSLKIKRNATSALGNILSDSRNHAILFQHHSETKLSKLIPQLACSAQQDLDPVIRRRAMRTIRCISSSTIIEAQNMIQKENLSPFLIDIISRKRTNEDENDQDVLKQACQTVVAIKGWMKADDCAQLQGALVELIQNTTSTAVIPSAALCLSVCLKESQLAPDISRIPIKFWNNLERLVSTSSNTHAAIAEFLATIVATEEKPKTVERQDQQHPSILTKTPVINALTTILMESKSTEEKASDQALYVIRTLATNEINKRPLAENDRLLSGLVNLCLLQPESNMKDLAKRIILELVPEI